jgi:hypothetical protein
LGLGVAVGFGWQRQPAGLGFGFSLAATGSSRAVGEKDGHLLAIGALVRAVDRSQSRARMFAR